jgi:alpha-L-rhamnosidase
MNRLIFIVIVLVFCSCNRSDNKVQIPLSDDLVKAAWISDTGLQPVNDSLFYDDDPAPLFRKEFTAEKDIKSAMLYITAAGYYTASINGKKVGNNYLDPAWTNYSKRIYYSEYDITTSVHAGINCIGVTTGNGFYNPLPMKMWGRYNLRDALPTGKPQFIAKLKLVYTDGKEEEICSGNTWKFAYGPVLKNNIYTGEVFNAGKEIPGWNKAGFDDSQWNVAKRQEGPGGKLQKTFFPAVQVTEIIAPLNISSTRKGVFIADMGVNFTGLYKIRIKGNAGDTVTFRFGERLFENGLLNPMTTVAGQLKREGMGGPGSPSLVCQTDRYIFGNKKEIWYSPEFTFHIYRYIEISGLSNIPDKTDIEGLAFNSNVENNNSFTCSSELLNSIQKATKRTFLNNLISVQSDCPGREKFGYGGDLNAVCESFIYNFNMHAFYRKTIYDWVDAMNDSVFIDTAPFVGIKNCGISWESAFLITQYKLLLFYNDVDIVQELYNLDLKWMEKVARLHPSGIVDKGLSDHESLEKVPVKLTGTTHYLECARIMKRFAELMNDRKNVKKFGKLADELTEVVLDMYWRKPVSDPVNRQTLFSTLLYYDIIPENEIIAATDSLMKAFAEGPSGHFTTGIFGTKYILSALSSTGHTGSVYEAVNSTSYPGWGFMIDRGATTIWETWKESDNVYSNCHPMFGSVSEWFFMWLGGIRPDPDYPGFKKFVIAPSLPDGLDYVKCIYHSPFGEIVSDWEKKGTNNQMYQIVIPEGSTASVIIPVSEQQKIIISEKGGNGSFSPDIKGMNHRKFDLKPGEYSISVTPGE